MSYYRAGGDYYRGGRGDFFGSLGGLAKRAMGIFGGPVGGVISAALPSRLPQLPPVVTSPFKTGMKMGTDMMTDAFGGATRKRRSMNPGNAKALRRAIRREDAFLNLAKRALHGRYTIHATHSRGSTKRKK